eukprot:NODE_5057_length_704_cov_2031.821490_g4894_i0.p1 GENE.NODE_5057_length_704_cov_2031.821490_g4894_i0~~NODE_5057_length_704_cov_2031.821490_g4894_i0.p1  ORF type:complete len:141 (-),score=27.19 NODE_5057_length_704_cov_2031.821490_g4894_i0:131-553(-)
MGRVRNKTVKKSAKIIIEKYYQKLTHDFYTNKKVIADVALIPTKRLRNKITGYTTHMMKRIARGPVRGISLKLQEEEREKRMDFAPEVSIIDQQISDAGIEVDEDTMEMLKAMDMSTLSHVRKAVPTGFLAQKSMPRTKY